MPQLSVGRVGHCLYRASGYLAVHITARARVEVGVERRVLIVLSPKDFPSQAIVQGQTRTNLPGILGIEAPLFVAVAAAEVGRADRQRYGAIGSRSGRADTG